MVVGADPIILSSKKEFSFCRGRVFTQQEWHVMTWNALLQLPASTG